MKLIFNLGPVMIAITALFSLTPAVTDTPPQNTALAKEESAINWLTISEIDAMAKSPDWAQKKRKVFIDVYTTWCGPCKMLNNTTFKDPRVVNYLNNNYYPVKFDAETEDTLVFGDHTYEFMPGGRRGTHRLAAVLASTKDGRMGYPTVVFLNEDMARIDAVMGYRPANELLPMLEYFYGNYHYTTPWDEFLKDYNSPDKQGTLGD